jgi:hypothetical protein
MFVLRGGYLFNILASLRVNAPVRKYKYIVKQDTIVIEIKGIKVNFGCST